MNRNWKVNAGIVAIVLILAALVISKVTSDNKGHATAQANGEAKQWVTQIVMNFDDVATVPAKCASWEPKNLDEVHFYNHDTGKESNTAFGTNMGDNPCDVSIALVERINRDPALALTFGKDLKLVDFKPEDQVKEINRLTSDTEARKALAGKVLGWYADPHRQLRIDHYQGAYDSDVMSAAGATSDVTSNHDSVVLTAYDRHTGKVESQRRMNCGGQKFKSHHHRNHPHHGCNHNCGGGGHPNCRSDQVIYQNRCVKREQQHDHNGSGGDDNIPTHQGVSEHKQEHTKDAPKSEPPPQVRDNGNSDEPSDHGDSGSGDAPAPTSDDDNSDSDEESSADGNGCAPGIPC